MSGRSAQEAMSPVRRLSAILNAAGMLHPSVFSSLTLAELAKDAGERKSTGVEFFKDEFELNWLMSRLGKPYVSIIHGTTSRLLLTRWNLNRT
jgi:enoyl-CoA hydratase/carnithine racemase